MIKTEELFLCQKHNFGHNGNFRRYSPIKFPKGTKIISVVIQDDKGDKKTINIKGKDEKQCGSYHDFMTAGFATEFPRCRYCGVKSRQSNQLEICHARDVSRETLPRTASELVTLDCRRIAMHKALELVHHWPAAEGKINLVREIFKLADETNWKAEATGDPVEFVEKHLPFRVKTHDQIQKIKVD